MFKLFDFHTHIFPEELAKRALPILAAPAKLTPATDGTLLGTSEYMRASGVDGFLVLNVATNAKQQENVNKFAVSVQESGLAESFGSFYPKAPDALEQLLSIHKAGLKGVKLHPEYQGYDIDDRSVYPLYEVIRDLGMIVVFHAGFDCAYPDTLHAPVPAVKRVADDFKGLKMVAAHFGGFLHYEEAADELAGKADIYLDTSCSVGYLDPALAEKIITRHGAERILFGSDCPWGSPRAHAEFIDSLRLTTREKELIFYENAKRLLGLGDKKTAREAV